MNKKFFGALLIGALTVTSTGTLVSCKDYDDDITNLQNQIDNNAKAIKEINDLIKNGGVIKDVASVTGGVKVTLSNGKEFTISNGQDGAAGKDGVSWTIGEDGFWYKDGEKTEYKAVGEKGDKGDKGDPGSNGSDGSSTNGGYYKPNTETHCFDFVAADGTVTPTDISYLATVNGVITATLDGENLTLNGVKGVTGDVVISLSGYLRGLVYMPGLYLDGIETTTYNWLNGDYLTVKNGITGTNHKGVSVTGLQDYLPNRLSENPTSEAYASEFYYGPAWVVKYHMNPSNSKVAFADVEGFNVLNPTIVNYHTRAAAADLGVTAAEKFVDGTSLFDSENGILSVGLQIKNPQLLEPKPTSKDVNENSNTIALKVKSKDSKGAESTITSDYALLQPQKALVEALYWKLAPQYVARKADSKRTTENYGDEFGVHAGKYQTTTADKESMVHVYDSPNEAVADPDGAALEMYYNDMNGINIAKYLGVHALQENFTKRKADGSYEMELQKWTLEEAAKWGLSVEFNLVDYTVGGNATKDSHYAKWVNKEKGILRAANVLADGKTEDAQSQTAVGREPLVQVLVKHNGSVVLDGYILVHITTVPAEAPDNKTIDFAKADGKFDFCNAIDNLKTTWSEFSRIILHDNLSQMTKEDFDKLYEPDACGTGTTDAEGNCSSKLNQYKEAAVKGGDAQVMDNIGEVMYYPNATATTNHVFQWTITEAEAEKLTHDKTSYPVEVSRYVRFKAKDAKAKYPYIYVKLTYNLSRMTVVANKFGVKLPEFWKALSGTANGFDAVIFDVKEPRNGMDIKTFNRSVTSTLKGSVSSLAENKHRYYFVPEAVKVTDEITGEKWTLTPQSSATDVLYNKLQCMYVGTDLHTYNKATLKQDLAKCAIRYEGKVATDGTIFEGRSAFDNNKLYAIDEAGVYHHIATLNQETSEITLDKTDDVTKAVLNAVGYKSANAHTNIELRAWLGVVEKNGCDVAKYVEDGIFLASWERPINIFDLPNKTVVDANTNGNKINVLDLIKLYDWRGFKGLELTEANCEANQSNMWGNHQWFWGYYNVKSITVDLTPNKVQTNLGGEWTTMDKVSKNIELRDANQLKQATVYNFDLRNYGCESQNDNLITYMNNNKDIFGVIYYYNNGNNVENFSVKVPITVEYEWGKFTKLVQIDIEPTIGD